MNYVKLNKVQMQKSPDLTEQWVQSRLVDDPSLLGLGELDVRQVERRQQRAGRLDMLLSDPDGATRYEVELQLGATDESHIIRTLEYWDNERRRYPQYEHVAVIVAEEITSRFFNVISLFNGFIPIVAIQMTALRLPDDQVSLVFTKVLDLLVLGTDEEDKAEPTNRSYWENKSTKQMMQLVDLLHSMIQEQDDGVTLKYNKYYIGLAKNDVANNYISMRPQKKKVNLHIRIPRSDEVTGMLDDSGLDRLSYDTRHGNYRIGISNRSLIEEHRQLLIGLIKTAKPD